MIATITRSRHDAMKKRAKKAGRPPKPEAQKLGRNVTVKFADEHQTLLERAVEASQKPLATFVRDAAISEARRVLGE